jgi:hypothetical protein
MAQGGNEHRMVFDIRGKRRHVVKVVYAILALLMGLSLFLVTGGLNLGSIFQSANSASSATKGLEERAQRLEHKVRLDPQNPDLLLALTRAQINTGNSMLQINPETGGPEVTPEGKLEYEHAVENWSRYLKRTDEPSPTAAAVVAATLFSLAENSASSLPELQANIKGATQAQGIAAKRQPNLNSLSTLAIYKTFAFDYAGAKKAEEEAKKFANSKFERENLENKLKEYSKRAHAFQKGVAKAEKAEKEGAAGGAAKEQLQNPLGGGLSGP